jgi:hypothetical protein
LVWEGGRIRQLTLEQPLQAHLRTTTELFGQPGGVWREVAVSPAGHGHMEVVKAFARAVRAGNESLLVATGEDGWRALELANAILLAGCARRQISLPLNRRHYTRLLRRLRRGGVTIAGAPGHPAAAGRGPSDAEDGNPSTPAPADEGRSARRLLELRDDLRGQ